MIDYVRVETRVTRKATALSIVDGLIGAVLVMAFATLLVGVLALL